MIRAAVPPGVSSEVIAAAHWLQSETQRRAPVTEYFFWPRNDAWDEVKAAMETKPYISERLAPCPAAFIAGLPCQLRWTRGAMSHE